MKISKSDSLVAHAYRIWKSSVSRFHYNRIQLVRNNLLEIFLNEWSYKIQTAPRECTNSLLHLCECMCVWVKLDGDSVWVFFGDCVAIFIFLCVGAREDVSDAWWCVWVLFAGFYKCVGGVVTMTVRKKKSTCFLRGERLQ